MPAVTDRTPRLAPVPDDVTPPPETARWTTVGDQRVHSRSWTGERVPADLPVVLVHGLAVASRMCRPVATQLAARHHVHAPDLPGFGESDKPGRTLGIAEQGQALAEWMDALGLDGALLAGTSLGCQIAAETALRHPRLCRLLVLGAPTVDRTRRSWRSQLWRWQVEQATQSLQLRRIQLSDYAKCGMRRAVRTFAAALEDRIEDKLPDVTAPVLVCRGTRDPLVSRAWAADLAGRAVQGRLAVLPGARHALSHESPLAFARAIAHFVDEHAEGS